MTSKLTPINPQPERRGFPRIMVKAFVAVALFCAASVANADTCMGSFPNLITDICWDCMFPITIGGSGGGLSGVMKTVEGSMVPSQEDYDTGPWPGLDPLCTCANNNLPPRSGIHISFWEFARQAEIVRQPYCMAALGAVQLNLGIGDSQVAGDSSGYTRASTGEMDTRFRQAHWYISPWMVLMQAIMDSNCLDIHGFDIAYLSEVDPTWTDEELDRIMNPEDYLFANIIGATACVIDAVQSDFTFGNNALFWCDGSNGTTGPLLGNADHVYGDVQGSTKYIHRVVQKLFRMMTQFAASGPNGMCGYYPQIVMDKRQWKYSMMFPVAQSSPDPLFGHCCQPLGRSTALWGAGRSFPYSGEDFTYAMFRKRDCCESVPGY